MFLNGKEIDYNPNASAVIQHAINSQDAVDNSLKSDLPKPKNILSDNFVSTGLADFEFSNNGFYTDNSNKDTFAQDRKGRYILYDEMDKMEFIHRGLELISDDGSQQNSEGNVIKITSNEETIKESLENLLLKRLDFNTNLWNIIYDTSKKGDCFFEVIPDSYEKPRKIMRLKYLEPEKVERIEVNGKLFYFKYITEKKTIDLDTGRKEKEEIIEYRLQPWQILHFKVMDDKEYLPYGGSLLKAGAKTYRRLSLLEDLMLVYRISRAPERRVFYVDVGNLTPIEAKSFLTKLKNSYRSQPIIDENGNLNTKANVLSITSDIFIPTREGNQSTRIEPLAGGVALTEIKDVDYFKDKILRTMNIPAAYLGETADRSRGSLSNLDINFSKFIERIQKQISQGINKICALELFFNGYKKEDLQNFTIEITPPSNIKEMSEVEVYNQKINLISTLQATNLFPNKWILKNILKLSDKEINDILLYKKIESGQMNTDGTMTLGGGMGGLEGTPGMGQTPGMEGMPVGATPPEGQIPGSETVAAAPLTPPVGGAEQLVASNLINLFGKEFIVEHKDDFFDILKYVKENNREIKIPLFEDLSELITKTLKVEKVNKANNNIEYLTIMNEMGGISFANESFKLYKKKKKANNIYEEIEISKETGNEYLKE